jgi:tRNA threonylcarbamoyladenosine biosynthesis protein TsaE
MGRDELRPAQFVTIRIMKATVIGLEGELGAGKTYFAQIFGKVLGVKENMPSPTFIIMKSYNIDPAKAGRVGAGFKKLIHIDAYRLEKDEELLNLGWNDLIEDPENLILIEWPEKVEGIMPKDATRLHFKHER